MINTKEAFNWTNESATTPPFFLLPTLPLTLPVCPSVCFHELHCVLMTQFQPQHIISVAIFFSVAPQ